MPDSLSQDKIVAYVGYLIAAALALWFTIRHGSEQLWKNRASALKEERDDLKIQVAAMKADKVLVDVALQQCQKSADERATSYFHLEGVMQEYKKKELQYKRDINYLERLIGKKLPQGNESDDSGTSDS